MRKKTKFKQLVKFKDIENKMCAGVNCIKLYSDDERTYWVHYIKLELDLVYYTYGFELSEREDDNFNTLEYGLKSINDFVEYVNFLQKNTYTLMFK